MRTYNEAHKYSMKNPTELVEFKEVCYDGSYFRPGSLLNGKREGVFEYFSYGIILNREVYNSKTSQTEHIYFWSDNSISSHYFRKNDIMHGEYVYFNKDRTVNDYCCYNSNTRIEELDYLINEPRDDAFYVTLSLYGIDKEYTFN